MRISNNGVLVLSAIMLVSVLGSSLVRAQSTDETDREFTRIDAKIAQMNTEMAAIESESDPEKRRRMLRDHMEDMHDAMAMMQKDLMPSMKRRTHYHKRFSGPATKPARAEPFDSDRHIEMMEEAMTQMEALMNQMALHRRAMRDLSE